MPVVTKLAPQKNKKFVNVYLDGAFAFGIDLENLYKFGLKAEKELSEEEVEKIIIESNFNKTLNKLLNFATLRPRSQKEIKDWFYKKKVESQLQPRLIEKLEKLDLINDEAFARWWTRQRLEFKKKSPKAIRYELLQKGIDSKTIDIVIKDADIDEFTLAQKAFEKKLQSLARYDDETKKKKLINFLKGKGFGWEVIKKVLEGIQ